MSLLRTWVLHNWGWKLLALLISFLLWAAYTAEPLAEAGYNAPIVFLNVPAGLTISGDEATQTHVVLRARAQLLRRVQPTDLAVSVDLAGGKEGENTVRLTDAQIDAPLGSEIARIAPAEIRVRLVRQ